MIAFFPDQATYDAFARVMDFPRLSFFFFDVWFIPLTFTMNADFTFPPSGGNDPYRGPENGSLRRLKAFQLTSLLI